MFDFEDYELNSILNNIKISVTVKSSRYNCNIYWPTSIYPELEIEEEIVC